ncbi:hypothetical protein N9A45_00220 [bacterium]|nr:hypothetical protein [bacterium]
MSFRHFAAAEPKIGRPELFELARVMHRKQIEEGKGHKREAPTDVLEHIASFLDHEMKSKLIF